MTPTVTPLNPARFAAVSWAARARRHAELLLAVSLLERDHVARYGVSHWALEGPSNNPPIARSGRLNQART